MRIVPSTAPILAAALLLVSCNDSAAATGDRRANGAEKQLPLVRVASLEERSIRRTIETPAFLESEFVVTVTSKIPGRVAEVLVDVGDRVNENTVLAKLDDREALASKRQVELQLQDRKLRHRLAEWEVKAAANRVQKAKIERNQAKAEFERLSKLDPDLVPPKDVDDARFARDAAEEAVKESEFNEQKAMLDVNVANQAIEEALARLEEAAARLKDHELVSPRKGIISKREVERGEAISTSIAFALFEIVDDKSLISNLKRPQRELPVIKRAKKVTFTADAYPDREFSADVDMISPVVDPDTGSFDIRVRVKRQDADVLVPGMFIRAKILTEESRNAIMVPKTAILAEGDESVVFVVRNGMAVKVILQTGLETATDVECRNQGEGGLLPNDKLIVSGQADLKDQTRVDVVETASKQVQGEAEGDKDPSSPAKTAGEGTRKD